MNDVIELYINTCIKQDEYNDAMRIQKSNVMSDKIRKLYRIIKEKNCLQELVPLLEHENPMVRMWSAYYCLPIAPQKAMKTLDSLSKLNGKPFISHGAKMTLELWRAGTLKIV